MLNILFLVVKKIIETRTIVDRRICREDVLDCRGTMIPGGVSLDFDKLPGKTIFDKKMLYGGFHFTELPRFYRERASAEYFQRRYSDIGMSNDIEELINLLLECQGECRHIICRRQGIHKNPGPFILEILKPKLGNITKKKSFPEQELSTLLCLGLIWSETSKCNVWWHGLEDSA